MCRQFFFNTGFKLLINFSFASNVSTPDVASSMMSWVKPYNYCPPAMFIEALSCSETRRGDTLC